MSKENIEEGMLYAESMFGFKSRQPIVKISYGITFEVQISPSEARHFAHSILEAAEAAETDAFMVEFIKTRVGINEDEMVAAFLNDFRKARETAQEEYEAEKRAELPKNIKQAVEKGRILCRCGHNLLAHDNEDEKDQSCKLIGCRCQKFERRKLM